MQLGSNGAINCSLDFTTNVRTGDLGSSRVFSDPAKSAGPFDGHHGRRRRARHHRDHGEHAPATPPAPTSWSWSPGLTPQDEGEEYTGAGDRTSGSTTLARASRWASIRSRTAARRTPSSRRVAALGKPWSSCSRAAASSTCPGYANAPAVVMAWYPGMVGGTALGQLLFGDVDFSGKLPITWDANLTPLADVRERHRHDDDGLLPRLPLLRQERHRAARRRRAASRSATACRTRRSATATCRCRAATSRRTASSTSPSTSPTPAPSPATRSCCCSSRGRARRWRPAPAATRSSRATAGHRRSCRGRRATRPDPAARQGPQVLGHGLVQLEGRHRHGEGDRGAERAARRPAPARSGSGCAAVRHVHGQLTGATIPTMRARKLQGHPPPSFSSTCVALAVARRGVARPARQEADPFAGERRPRCRSRTSRRPASRRPPPRPPARTPTSRPASSNGCRRPPIPSR